MLKYRRAKLRSAEGLGDRPRPKFARFLTPRALHRLIVLLVNSTLEIRGWMCPGSHNILAGSHLVAPLTIPEYTRVLCPPLRKTTMWLGSVGILGWALSYKPGTPGSCRPRLRGYTKESVIISQNLYQ